MSILITGGCGYIGSHTCVELINAGFEIVVLDNLYNSKKESLKRVCEITGKSIPFYECDIRDREGLDKIFKQGHFINEYITAAELPETFQVFIQIGDRV